MDCVEANRRVEAQRKEFAVRMYRWAEQDLQHELEVDFARVRRVKSSRAFHYLEFIAPMSDEERSRAAFALLRGSIAHKLAREQLGLELEPSEKEYVQRYTSRFYPVAWPSEFEKKLRSRVPAGEFELDHEEFEAMLLPQISEALGLEQSRHGVFVQQIGSWYLESTADVRSIYQLRYGQYILARKMTDLCAVQLRQDGGTSVLGWLGIDPGTNFNLLRKSEMQEAVAFVAEAMRHYAKAVPGLLEGLTHDVPQELEDSRPISAKKKRAHRKYEEDQGSLG